MAFVTLQVIDGLEKGRTFENLPTPVTIGREDDNTIRLNDERVSRFHVKIQEDGGRLILTDLDSTNGTRVNGHPVQMRVLQFGDQLAVGRSLLVFGSPEQVQKRRAEVEAANRGDGNQTVAANAPGDGPVEELFPDGPPEVPEGLRPVQAAQLSDILAYVHHHIAVILDNAEETETGDFTAMHVDWMTWQRLLEVEMSLAKYLRTISDPKPEE